MTPPPIPPAAAPDAPAADRRMVVALPDDALLPDGAGEAVDDDAGEAAGEESVGAASAAGAPTTAPSVRDLRALEAVLAEPRWSTRPDADLAPAILARLVRAGWLEAYASCDLERDVDVTRYRGTAAGEDALARFRAARERHALARDCPVPRVRQLRAWIGHPGQPLTPGRGHWREPRGGSWSEWFDGYGRRFLRRQHGCGPADWYREEGAWYHPSARS